MPAFAVCSSMLGCEAPAVRQEPAGADAANSKISDVYSSEPQAASHAPAAGASHASGASAEYGALPLPGFLPAVLYVPPGAGQLPLIVAAHGAGGVPEAECAYWLRLTGGSVYLLCLRGTRIDERGPSGYYYRTHLELERELQAALSAFRARFGEAQDTSGNLYVGFSQGAIMGAAMIPAHARSFPRLVLIEGGYEYWSAARARTFARNGGQRVLFVCGTQWCAQKSEAPSAWLRQAGVEVRVEHAEGAGHTPGGSVMSRTRAALPWVTQGAEGWDL